MKFILATCVRNEGPYLLEWVVFHRMLGFDEVIIFSNDNDDGSDDLLQAMKKHGLIDWRPRRINAGDSPQMSAFLSLSKELLEKNVRGKQDYLAWFDCDEFLVLRKHETIKDLLNYYSYPDSLLINWKHFGSNNHEKYGEDLTINRFVRCDIDNSLNKGFKAVSKINNDLYKRLENHRPIARSGYWGRVQYANDLSVQEYSNSYKIPREQLLNGKLARAFFDTPFFHEVCHLNHYATRSVEEYLWKAARGNGWLAVDADKLHFRKGYFREHDLNDDYDDHASVKYSGRLKEILKNLPADLLEINKKVINDCLFFYSKTDLSCEQSYGVKRNVSDLHAEQMIFIQKFIAGYEKNFYFFDLDQKHSQAIDENFISVSGVILPKKHQIFSIRLVSENFEMQAKIGISSPALHKKFPNISNSHLSRFNFEKFNFEVGKKYFLIVDFDKKIEICLVEIVVR